MCARTRVRGEGGCGDRRGAGVGTRSTRVTSSGTHCKRGMLQGGGLQEREGGWHCPGCVLNLKHPEMGPRLWLPTLPSPCQPLCPSRARLLLPPSPFCPLPAAVGSQPQAPPPLAGHTHAPWQCWPLAPRRALLVISLLHTRQALPRRDLAKVQAVVQSCVEAGVAVQVHK